MRVIFFNSCRTWGGGEKWHFDMANALHKEGHKVHVFVSPESELHKRVRAINIDYQTITVSSLSFVNPVAISRLSKKLSSYAADVIIINLSADLKFAGIAAKKAGIKHIIYRRGSAIPIKNRYLNRYLFSTVLTEVLANSEETKRTINALNPNLFPSDKIKVIYNGLDPDNWADVALKDYQNGPIILGNLARLSKQKNQSFLIDLAHDLKQNGISFRLNIGGEGELRSQLENQIKEKGLEEEVQLCGFIEDVKSFYENTDIVVFPSIWEGFGFSIVEAKLAGRPVVAFDITSNPEVLNDKSEGYLIKPFNRKAFYAAVVELINNQDLRNSMGEKGRKDALQRFSIHQTRNALIEYLDNLG